MITRKNNEVSLSKVEVNTSGVYLYIVSDHVESLILAVETAKNTGWNRISGADVFDGKVSLILIKSEGSAIDLPTLRGAIRRQDTDLIMACNSEDVEVQLGIELVQEEFVQEELVQEELVQEEEVDPTPEQKPKAKKPSANKKNISKD